MAQIGDHVLSAASERLLAAALIFLVAILLDAWTAMPAPAAYSPPAHDGDGGWVEIEDELEEEEPAPGSILPPECLLRTARPRAIVDPTPAPEPRRSCLPEGPGGPRRRQPRRPRDSLVLPP